MFSRLLKSSDVQLWEIYGEMGGDMGETSKKPAASTKIKPRIGEWETDALGEIILIGTHCTNCNESFFPGHDLCVRCGSAATERHEVRGPATLRNFTVVHQLPPGFESPWTVGYGVFSGQVVVLAPIVGAHGDELHEGTQLALKEGVTHIDSDGEKLISYQFTPVIA
jgi:uncharacterized OB-fold protein